MRKFKKDDKVIVKGIDLAFVVVGYLDDGLIKLRLEGESLDGPHSVISARPDVVLPNNKDSAVAEGWIDGDFEPTHLLPVRCLKDRGYEVLVEAKGGHRLVVQKADLKRPEPRSIEEALERCREWELSEEELKELME